MLGFLIIFTIFFLLFSSPAIYDKIKYSGRYFWEEMSFTFVFSLLSSLILIMIFTQFDKTYQEEKVQKQERIYSLFNDSSIEGQFFLLVGSVSSNSRYVYLKKNKRGNYTKGDIVDKHNGEIEIKLYDPEKNTLEPKIIRYYNRVSNEGFWTFDYDYKRLKRTVIQIPEGSLKRQIQIK